MKTKKTKKTKKKSKKLKIYFGGTKKYKNCEENIDIVIPWAGENLISNLSNETEIEQRNSLPDSPYNRYNNELKYCLRSIYKYALNWVNRIIIFVNKGTNLPSWIDPKYINTDPYIINKNKIYFIDRCKYFKNKEWCPNFNFCAISANIHKIPLLTGKFLVLMDDCFFGNYVFLNDFFEGNKTTIWDNKLVPIYKDWQIKKGPIVPPNAPLSFGTHAHLPYPFIKKYIFEINKKYPKLLDFISSHKFRWSCCEEGYENKNISPGLHLQETFVNICHADLFMRNEYIYKSPEKLKNDKIFVENTSYSNDFFEKLKVIKTYKPKFINFNDSWDPNHNQSKYLHDLTNFLDSYYPDIPYYEITIQ